MGTSWSARFVAPPGTNLAPIRAALVAELDAVIAEMSNWEHGSAISRFNAGAAARWHGLPPALFHVVQAGVTLAEASGGAFDPSAGALVDVWGFGPAPARLMPPGEAEIAAALGISGWRRLALDPHARRVFQPGGLRLDLSGIAKGHAVDRLVLRLAETGFPHSLVEIGGELRGSGVKPDGQPWWVALELPPGAVLEATRVALHGLSIATSGNYRRWFKHDGRRYAHSIDPRTGHAVANDIASVTVVHAECMMADALATALLVLGEEDGLAFADERNVATLIVIRDGAGFRETLSPAFAAMLD